MGYNLEPVASTCDVVSQQVLIPFLSKTVEGKNAILGIENHMLGGNGIEDRTQLGRLSCQLGFGAGFLAAHALTFQGVANRRLQTIQVFLQDIVFRARSHTAHRDFLALGGGYDQNRQSGMVLPDELQDFISGETGQREIRQHQIEALNFQRPCQILPFHDGLMTERQVGTP